MDGMKFFEITCDNKGKIKLEAHGYKGDECIKASEKLEESLGLKEGKRTLKGEFYQKVVNPVKVRLGL
jgi:hypothetical protein